ncbi:hypothetical protein O3P69_004451 [Scylla paramamosain]|uniref:Thyrotropin-releasing hormone receptor n=1 Tax=Scylla paramamosain TaxID=85552 RepID=A0AAW0UFG0_SCYPA
MDVLSASNMTSGNYAGKNSIAEKKKVVKMLVVVVAIFATLWLPYRTLLVYNSVLAMFGHSTYKDLWYLLFAKTCIFINSAINPILYNALSVKFRRAFKRMLSCGKPRPEQWAMTMFYSEGGKRPASRITGGVAVGGRGPGSTRTRGSLGIGRESSSPRQPYPPSSNRQTPTMDTPLNPPSTSVTMDP